MDAASGGPCTLEALYDTAEFRMYCMKVRRRSKYFGLFRGVPPALL